MPEGGVLALDLASVTGWAVCGPDYRPTTALEAAAGERATGIQSGSHRVAPPNTPIGPFLDRFMTWIADMIAAHAPDFLVFEAPILTAGKTSIDTARRLMCLAGITELVAHQKKVAIVREVHLQEVKKHWTGDGRADKGQMIRAAQARGFAPRDDNEADALAVMDFAASVFFKNRRAA